MHIILLAFILVVAGIVLGDEAGRDMDWIAGGGIGLLLALHFGLRRRLRRLEKQIEALKAHPGKAARAAPDAGAGPYLEPGVEGRVEAVSEDGAYPDTAPGDTPAHAPPPPPPPGAAPAPLSAAAMADGTPETADGDPWTDPPTPPEPTRASVLLDTLRERALGFLRGGNPMVRIGVVVLFFGVAFLLKYTAELGLLPIELRLVGVLAGAVAMLVLGWRLRRTRPEYGLILQGGGVGLIYLTVFAAYRLYDLIPPTAAMALLVATVVFAGFIAVVQSSRSIAVLGSAGGFLAPVLASTGEGSHVALFAYYLLLDLGILGIAWFKAWRALNLVGFVFTFVIAALWGYRFYGPGYLASTEPFLIAFFLLYTAVAVLFALRQPPRLRGLVDSTLVFGTPLVAFALQSRLVSHVEHGLTYSAIAVALFYVLLAAFLYRRFGERLRMLVEAFLASGVVFATIAIPLGLDARWTAVSWALEGAGALWMGTRQGRLLPRIAGAALQILAGVSLVLGSYGRDEVAFLNGDFLGAAVIAAASVFCGAWLYLHRERLHRFEAWLPFVLGAWGLAWWFVAGIREADVRVPHGFELGALLLFFALSALIFERIGARIRYPLLDYPALALVPALLLMLLVIADNGAHPFMRGGHIGWPVAIAAAYYLLRRLERTGLAALGYLHAAGLWLLTMVTAWQVGYGLDAWTDHGGPWSRLALGLVPAAFVLVVVLGARALAWPLGRFPGHYRVAGVLPLVAWLLVWLVFANFADPELPWAIAYLPILNPLDLASLAALTALFAWWRSAKERVGEIAPHIDWPLTIGVGMGALLFYWANTVLLRSVHAWGDVAYRADALAGSTLVQTSLTVFWAILGLLGMVLGARRGSRMTWLIAAALMSVVVVKLFLVDLASTGTLARIVSFLTVGALLLAVGYFAPVPPRRPAPDEPLPGSAPDEGDDRPQDGSPPDLSPGPSPEPVPDAGGESSASEPPPDATKEETR